MSRDGNILGKVLRPDPPRASLKPPRDRAMAAQLVEDFKKKLPVKKIVPMPKEMQVPSGQLWVRWVCTCCKKQGLMTVPSKGQGSGCFPFEIALGVHRTISKSCNVKDVTMRGGKDGVLEVVLERGKSASRA